VRVLITAGGTTEPIDSVRGITNHSTGKLGAKIATSFFAEGHTVDYITTKAAVPVTEKRNLNVYYIKSAAQLEETLEELMKEQTYDAVIHSMAVSDYTPANTTSGTEFIRFLNKKIMAAENEDLATDLREALTAFCEADAASDNKISSAEDELVVVLKKTPKIIQSIKQLQPETILVGFKLLVDVTYEELVDVALAALQKNNADFVLANDLTSISGEEHIGLLVHPDGGYEIGTTKAEIAKMIVKTVEHKVVEKGGVY
jgi:phosphopantothenate-cysteine ligase